MARLLKNILHYTEKMIIV